YVRCKEVNKVEFQEKKLYHQIHPLKLLTDWITGVISLYILWSHQIVTALIVMFVPSILVSIIIMKYVNLEKLKNSSFVYLASKKCMKWHLKMYATYQLKLLL